MAANCSNLLARRSGFWRIVPVANGEPQWNSASTWSQPISISTIPGSGSIQTMSVFMYGNGSKLQQSFWRGDQGFWRIVPVANGEPQWSCGVVPTATPGGGGSCTKKLKVMLTATDL